MGSEIDSWKKNSVMHMAVDSMFTEEIIFVVKQHHKLYCSNNRTPLLTSIREEIKRHVLSILYPVGFSKCDDSARKFSSI